MVVVGFADICDGSGFLNVFGVHEIVFFFCVYRDTCVATTNAFL